MTQSSGIAGVADARDSRRTLTMAAALAWEECRVGGVIAAWASTVNLLILAYFRSNFGVDAMVHSAEFVKPIIVGPLPAIAIFLILNTNNSGDLSGGFSTRVLRLPVSTRLCVAVALLSRTAFVALSSLVVVGSAMAMFNGSVGLSFVGLVILFYLAAQTLDWLREPVSGMTSLLLLGCAAAAIVLLRNGWEAIWEHLQTVWVNPLAVVGATLAVYAISVPVVHAGRIGRRIGVPEIWDWPSRISLVWPVRHRAFASPMAAQIWYELRSSAAWLPVLMVGIWAALRLLFWLTGGTQALDEPDEYQLSGAAKSVFPFLALLLACVTSGLWARMLREQSGQGHDNYAFLLPMTSAQLATAFIVANALVFVPTLLIAMAGHFYGTIAFEMIGRGVALGTTSYREAAWILLSRGIFVGLIAWPMLAVKTRPVRGVAGGAAIIVTLTIAWYVWTGSKSAIGFEVAVFAMMLLLIGTTTLEYARAWRTRLIPTGTLLAWTAAWLLTAWLLSFVMWSTEPDRTIMAAIVTGVSGLAFASVVPLPYAAAVMSIARHRQSSRTVQDAAQHRQFAYAMGHRGRTIARVLGACVVAFVIWLCWPQRPAQETLWRSAGYPTSLAELNDWYEAVPDDANIALDYITAATAHEELYSTYYERRDDWNDNVLIVGSADVEIGDPIPAEVRLATEAYWAAVTSKIAPKLKAIAAKEDMGSRYPIDLREGPGVELPHLARLRALVRELHVDALHWVWAGDTKQAADSVLAIFPIADSLKNEPVLISQLVRIALEGMLVGTLEDVMHQAEFAEGDLARMQRALGDAANTPAGVSPMTRAMVGESLFYFDAVGRGDVTILGYPGVNLDSELEISFVRTPFLNLLFPVAAERMAAAQLFYDTLFRDEVAEPQSLHHSYWDAERRWTDDEVFVIAPMSSFALPVMFRVQGSEIRNHTMLDAARTAVAVERYRLANGRLPDSLDSLTPTYLDAIPKDAYAGGASLRYLVREGGGFVVYSVGLNGEDDRGAEIEHGGFEGDIPFAVAGQGRAD